MNIPSQIVAGDSVSWNDDPGVDSLGAEVSPAAGYTLKYAIRGESAITLTSTTHLTGWQTTLSKTNSGSLSAGDYVWQAYAEKTGVRVTLGSGTLKVLQNISSLSAGDEIRSQAKQDLDAVQGALRALAKGGMVKSYTIGNRNLQRMDMADIIKLEQKLKQEVSNEEKAQKIAQGLGNPDRVMVRFRN